VASSSESMRREVQFEPGYNHVAEGRGRHGMSIRFLLHGELGTTQFVMNTGWVPGEYSISPQIADLTPMAVDLGFHWRTKPDANDYWFASSHCQALGDADCWYDGSGLNAEPVTKAFIDEGEETVWKRLEEYYDSLVVKYPPVT